MESSGRDTSISFFNTPLSLVHRMREETNTKAEPGVTGFPPNPSFETFSREVLDRYSRNWKPGTLAISRVYFRNQILPWFQRKSITAITRIDVELWMASLHTTPAAANRSLPILSVILEQAELCGLRPRDSNPCRGIRRFPQQGRERFLNPQEMRQLGAALAAYAEKSQTCTALIKLLLLTGCRQSEIRTLRWHDYRQGSLFLTDSKTGPRRVWLSSLARDVLDSLPRTAQWVFPAGRHDCPISTETLYRHWRALRQSCRLKELRLHDLRHNYASFALRLGESVPTIARLLGHRNSSTTLKYTHLADESVRDAVETLGEALWAE